MESRELVHFVTQQTRFALINNILQHPEQLPSMNELDPSVSDSTVPSHTERLYHPCVTVGNDFDVERSTRDSTRVT